MGGVLSCCYGDEEEESKEGAFSSRFDEEDDQYDPLALTREQQILLHEKIKSSGSSTLSSSSSGNEYSITGSATSAPDDGRTAAARRKRSKVCCSPLDLSPLSTFNPISYPKSEGTTKFLMQSLSENFIFDTLDQVTKLKFVGAMQPEEAKQDKFVVHQGDTGDFFYILAEGIVAFHVEPGLSEGQLSMRNSPQVGTGMKGASFGELALLYNAPRAASIRAVTPLKLYKIDQLTFRSLVMSDSNSSRSDIVSLLKMLPTVQDLEEDQVQKLAEAVTTVEFAEGERIVNKGDIGAILYMVKSGKVKLTNIGHAAARFEDQVLETGKYFGERALFEGETRGRAADVTALTKCSLLAISKGVLEASLGPVEELLRNSALKAYLLSVPLLHNLTADEIDRCVKRLHFESFKKNERIVPEGKLYLIQEGHGLMMLSDIPDEISTSDKKLKAPACHLVKLEKGDYFGDPFPPASPKPQDSNVKRPSVCRHSSKRHSLKKLNEDTLMVESDMKCLTICASDIQFIIGDLNRMSLRSGKNEEEKENARKFRTMRRMGSSVKMTIPKRIKMSLNKLAKHRLLGSGAFGKVWLVTSKNEIASNRESYALKIMSKRQILNQQMVKPVMREKNVMESVVGHPFLLHMVSSFQDENYLYFVNDLIIGGELFDILYGKSRVSSKQDLIWKESLFYQSFGSEEDRPLGKSGLGVRQATFYSACVIDAFSYLHNRRIVYRDLKPENVMINSKGYAVIVDMGFAKVVPQQTFTMCGTLEYIAPELISNRGHNQSADYWSFGCLVYEMIAGKTPFISPGISQIGLLKNILRGRYTFPPQVHVMEIHSSDVTKLDKALISWIDLVRRLLKQKSERLGNLQCGIEDILSHSWFNNINFNELRKQNFPGPVSIGNPLENVNITCDTKPEKFRAPLSDADQEVFKDF